MSMVSQVLRPNLGAVLIKFGLSVVALEDLQVGRLCLRQERQSCLEHKLQTTMGLRKRSEPSNWA